MQKNHFLLLKKLKNTESAQLCARTCIVASLLQTVQLQARCWASCWLSTTRLDMLPRMFKK